MNHPHNQHGLLTHSEILDILLDTTDEMVVIIDSHGCIVMLSKSYKNFCRQKTISEDTLPKSSRTRGYITSSKPRQVKLEQFRKSTATTWLPAVFQSSIKTSACWAQSEKSSLKTPKNFTPWPRKYRAWKERSTTTRMSSARNSIPVFL